MNQNKTPNASILTALAAVLLIALPTMGAVPSSPPTIDSIEVRGNDAVAYGTVPAGFNADKGDDHKLVGSYTVSYSATCQTRNHGTYTVSGSFTESTKGRESRGSYETPSMRLDPDRPCGRDQVRSVDPSSLSVTMRVQDGKDGSLGPSVTATISL